MKKKRLGFIVNPIAGIGGKVGLKGSDGYEIIRKAKKLKAIPESPIKAIEALKKIINIKDDIKLFSYPYDMGEYEAKKCGLSPIILGKIKKSKTSPNDTENAAKEMLQNKVDLLLFVGGDGTARNIFNAIGESIPVLGVPAGVKMHSAVFATNPQNAGNLAVAYLKKGESSHVAIRKAEVMDVDEKEFRRGNVSAKLYGYMKIPYEKALIQGPKVGNIFSEKNELDTIASTLIDNMRDECLFIIGPGTTTEAIMKKLGLKNTLLGVDAVYCKKLVGSDLNEKQLLEIIKKFQKTKIIVTIIGGQGYLFGRGNPQISAEVIKKVGKENIIVIATKQKLLSLKMDSLLVDTGNYKVDKILTGYIRVITGINEEIIVKVST